MGEFVCIDVETIPLGGKECVVETSKGPISVFVCGDREKPALVTYPDVALNYMSCFQGLFFCPEATTLLLHNFCIYHIDAPGHELGAASISMSVPVLSVDELADKVAEVIDFFGIKKVMCLGVSAGAYVLTLFAVKYSERVLGLILVSPLCKAPSWTEWFYNMVLLNLLYYYGMCGLVKDCLLQRYFSKDFRSAQQSSESDIAHTCRKLLDERQSVNVMRFLQAINQRRDLSRKLGLLKCRTLIFVGDKSPFYSDACHMISKLDKRFSTLVEVQVCGSIVTEEQPHAMLIPMEFFLMQFGIHRQRLPPAASTFATCSKASPASTALSVPAELFSPEALGIKLKPIRTRATVEV